MNEQERELLESLDLSNPSKEAEDRFHVKLFSILFKVPKDFTIEQAAVWGMMKATGLFMQELADDSGSIIPPVLEALSQSRRPRLNELYPQVTSLVQRLLPYFTQYSYGIDDLGSPLVDPDTFIKTAYEAAGDDPELVIIAKDLEKVMEVLRDDNENSEDEFEETF